MTDTEIIELLVKREDNAITELSKKYNKYCRHIAKNILDSKEDIEECLNDVYLAVWNSIPPANPGNLATFIGKIMRNICFNKYKANKTQKHGNGEFSYVLDELSDMLSITDDTEEIFDRKELVEIINSFLKSIDKDKRYMFVRRYWYTDSVKSIANDLKISEGSVSVTLGRLRKKLVVYLSERGFYL